MEVTSENPDQVFHNLYGTFSSRHRDKIKMKFKKGDLVPLSKVRGVFDKKYELSFTDEVFTVTDHIPRTPPLYKLENHDGEPIEGSFYEAELQKVKMAANKKQVFVRWKNWPEKFNSWVTFSDVVGI